MSGWALSLAIRRALSVVSQDDQVQDVARTIVTRAGDNQVPSFYRDRSGARGIVCNNPNGGVGPRGVGVHRWREVFDAAVSGAQQIDSGGIGAEPESKSAPAVRVGRVQRSLEHLADPVQDDADARDGGGVGTKDETFGGDGLGGEDGKDGKGRIGRESVRRTPNAGRHGEYRATFPSFPPFPPFPNYGLNFPKSCGSIFSR